MNKVSKIGTERHILKTCPQLFRVGIGMLGVNGSASPLLKIMAGLDAEVKAKPLAEHRLLPRGTKAQ
jgi:hypothetical protein